MTVIENIKEKYNNLNPVLKKIIDFLPYLAIVLFIMIPWFAKSGYLFFVDFISGPKFDGLSLSFGFFNLGNILIYLLGDFGQKLFLSLIYLLILFGTRSLVSNFTKNKIVIFLVSLFAVFNPFIYDRTGYGQFGVIMSFGFMTFALSYVFKFIESIKTTFLDENKKISVLSKFVDKNILLVAIFSAFSIVSTLHSVFFVAFYFLICFIYTFIYKKNVDFKKIISTFILSIFIIFVVNIGFLGQIFFSSSYNTTNATLTSGITKQDLKAFATSGKDSWDTLYNVIVSSGFWGRDQYRYSDIVDISSFYLTSFIILCFVIFGAYRLYKERKYKFLFTILTSISLVAIILAVGIRSGLTKPISEFLFDYLPFYKGLREPQKWVSLLTSIYLVFLTFSLTYIFDKIKKDYIRYISAFVFGFIIVLNSFYLAFGANGQFVPSEYPKEWYEAAKDMKNDKCGDGKVLILPWHMYMDYSFINNDKKRNFGSGVVAPITTKVFDCPLIVGTNMEWGGIYDNFVDPNSKLIQDWFTSGLTDKDILKKMGVSYVLLLKEVDYQNFVGLKNINYLQVVSDNDKLILLKLR